MSILQEPFMSDQVVPLNFSKILKERQEFLAHHATSEKVDNILKRLIQPQSIAEAIQTIHEFQRLYLAYALDVAHHPTIITALEDEKSFPTWKHFIALQATEAQKNKLVRLMVHGDPDMRWPVLLNLSDYSREVGEKVVAELLALGHEFDLWIDDAHFQRRLFNLIDDSRATAFGDLMAQRYEVVKRSIGFRSNNPSTEPTDPVAPSGVSQKYFQAFTNRKKHGDQFYTITVLPTEKDAELDNIPYDDYVDLFFRMCDVDWDKINEAHIILKEKLDNGKVLQITNNDGTDVTMDIEGFTFCNSRVAKNVPGSEVFSAPRRDSVNGKIVAKGRFLPKTSKELIENITLEIKDGLIVHYYADVGNHILKSIIETDEGSRYFGEIGIGTNPVLKQHITNSLMVEKIGGSFHMAIGAAYQYTDYLGEPVTLDNGNRSSLHIDITTMLYGKEGMMYLDGKIIMQNGKFTDPALAYLNGTE